MKFNAAGLLPQGIHTTTWENFQKEFGFTPCRKELLKGLHKVFFLLTECGCEALYIDGSMVTDKPEPDDWDACFKGSKEAIERLKQTDPDLVLDDFAKRERQKAKYGGELYPADVYAEKDSNYIEFFQHVKGSKRKKALSK